MNKVRELIKYRRKKVRERILKKEMVHLYWKLERRKYIFRKRIDNDAEVMIYFNPMQITQCYQYDLLPTSFNNSLILHYLSDL